MVCLSHIHIHKASTWDIIRLLLELFWRETPSSVDSALTLLSWSPALLSQSTASRPAALCLISSGPAVSFQLFNLTFTHATNYLMPECRCHWVHLGRQKFLFAYLYALLLKKSSVMSTAWVKPLRDVQKYNGSCTGQATNDPQWLPTSWYPHPVQSHSQI